MFIIENKKITNAKSLSIGKAVQFDIQLKFINTTFSDDDIFELTIDSKKSSLYGFVESGCLRFTRVDFSWIVAENTTAPISVKCNGSEILADSINISAEVCGGGGTGGGSSVEGNPATGHRVRFYDYEGTLLKTHYVENGESANPPTTPEHERLLFQQWNNDFSNITRAKDVGAIYDTVSGWSEFDIVVGQKKGLTLTFSCRFYEEGVVDWGDGTKDGYNAGWISQSHTYPDYGNYTVKIKSSSWRADGNLYERFGNVDIIRCYFATGHILNGSNGVSKFNLRTLREYTFASGAGYFGTGNYVQTLKAQICPKEQTTFYGGTTNNDIYKAIVLNDNITVIDTNGIANVKVDEVVLPDGLTTLGTYCFGQNFIRKVFVPEGVTAIPTDCFANSKQLEEVKFASPNLTSIGAKAFSNCNALHNLYLYAEIPPTLEENSIYGETNLACIYVPAGCAEAYKAATNWSVYADIIKEMEN